MKKILELSKRQLSKRSLVLILSLWVMGTAYAMWALNPISATDVMKHHH